jgi:hypothetical protein
MIRKGKIMKEVLRMEDEEKVRGAAEEEGRGRKNIWRRN